MRNSEPLEDVLFEREVLRSTIIIRNYFLAGIVTDIYENTGQLLSAVRVKLELAKSATNDKALEESGELVGESMRNLRAMSRNFYPENHLDSPEELVRLLNLILLPGKNILPPTQLQEKVHLTLIDSVLQSNAAILILGIFIELFNQTELIINKVQNCRVTVSSVNVTIEIRFDPLTFVSLPIGIESSAVRSAYIKISDRDADKPVIILITVANKKSRPS